MNPNALAFLGAAVAVLYVLRLNDMRVGHHLPRCIAVQSLGLLASLWIYGSTNALPLWAQWCNAVVLLMLMGHLIATSERWIDGAPKEAETAPSPLDAIEL